MSQSAPFRYADLFAGIGGFAAALNGFGGEHAYSVEIDSPAARVYALNWGHDPLGDITQDATDTVMNVGQHDILAGGFPCQPFSKSGAQKGMDEIRGTLFFNIMEAIQARRPTVVVLENVRNLVGPRHTHEWAVIIERLRAEGYQVSETPAIFSPHQIDPSFGGSPQVRDRVLITATRVPDGHVADPIVDPVTLLPEVRMHREWDLAEDLPLEDAQDVPGTALSNDEITWVEHWDKWVQVMLALRAADADAAGEPARRLPGFPIWANVWVISPKERNDLMHPGGVRVPAWKAVFLEKNWYLYDRLRQADPRWLATWLAKTRTFPESRQKLEWQAQDETSMWNCVISLRPSGLRVKRMTHLPALVAITQTPILGPRRRRLSPREAARLQGMPDEYDFGAQRDALTYKQLGNGVNVGVVWNVLKAHVERDRELLLATAKGRSIYTAISSAPAHPTERVRRALRQSLDFVPTH
ncbi:DNA (cytosine-5-)-methyltransferase [Pengzhenrongella sicca]|uniref:Cytosine-specific methyltransferase n=1 Tax=Pengzhenrongella sicca TaxID=2819238 RepID=A0A8A4ZF45_9MICO|nr:DNA (cytosine-5-)-methyltransferase [Pengzhenrongella sicca]QTE30031.1 DNA (cytosine-5-)-methyltransferase [Pengzhenrongella sicca]